MRATVTEIDVVAPDIFTYWFQPERKLRFDAGQFVELYLPHSPVDNRGEWREFSLSSSPHEERFSITTNFFTKGSSFKLALQALAPGTLVVMNEPMGDFVLPKDDTIPLVFIAAGLGIMPYVSMIKWLQHRSEQRPIQLIHGVRYVKDLYYRDLIERYGLEYIPIITRPDKHWSGSIGRLTVPTLFKLIGPTENKLIYLAGPQSLIEPFFNTLLAAGIPRSQLLLDYYPGY